MGAISSDGQSVGLRSPRKLDPSGRLGRGRVRATHFLLHRAMAERLLALSESTRVPQAEYIREALRDLLAKHGGRTAPTRGHGPGEQGPLDLVSVVARLERGDLAALGRLVRSTRVRAAEYWREAIGDVLRKHRKAVRA